MTKNIKNTLDNIKFSMVKILFLFQNIEFMSIKRTSKYKIFLSVMILSFLWVIIGDLVAMHIKLIYDVDIQSQYPFTKTQKTDSKTYKTQKNKSSDDNQILYLDFFVISSNTSVNLYEFKNTNFKFISELKSKYKQNYILGRSPPVC